MQLSKNLFFRIIRVGHSTLLNINNGLKFKKKNRKYKKKRKGGKILSRTFIIGTITFKKNAHNQVVSAVLSPQLHRIPFHMTTFIHSLCQCIVSSFIFPLLCILIKCSLYYQCFFFLFHLLSHLSKSWQSYYICIIYLHFNDIMYKLSFKMICILFRYKMCVCARAMVLLLTG